MRRTMRSLVVLLMAAGLMLSGGTDSGAIGPRPGQDPLKRLVVELLVTVLTDRDFEPTGNTQISQDVRAAFVVKSVISPATELVTPAAGVMC